MNAILKNHRVLGLTFIGLMILSVWLVNAVFTQKFKSFDYITLSANEVGLQMPDRADVKVRGKIVGQVTRVESNPGKATLTLGIEPDLIGGIPKNVTASLLPKTLFGEKYVSLVIPQSPAGKLAAGDKIQQNGDLIEVERLLNDLYPLLRTVQPAELSYTLNALATALEGRGDRLGENIEVLNNYLKRFNPQLPALIADLRLLAEVSDTYADVMPEIAQTLRNSVTTGNTLLEKEKKLNTFLRDVASFSGTAEDFLDANGDNIVKLGNLSDRQLRVLAKYAPEFPCLLGGIVNAAPKQAETFRGFIFHINLRTLPRQARGYRASEASVYGAKNGPRCGALPSPPWSPKRPFKDIPDLNDGAAKPNKRAAALAAGDLNTSEFQRSLTPVAGTPEEKAMVVSLTAPAMGRSADEVADLTTLLYGPLVRGSEVSVR